MNTCGKQRAPLPVRKPKQTGLALHLRCHSQRNHSLDRCGAFPRTAIKAKKPTLSIKIISYICIQMDTLLDDIYRKDS
jgi:hypothetical protein